MESTTTPDVKKFATSETTFFKSLIGKKICVEFIDGKVIEGDLIWVEPYTLLINIFSDFYPKESVQYLIYKQSIKSIVSTEEH